MLVSLAHGFGGGLLFARPKSNQKGSGTYGFRTSLDASGNRLRHPWPSVWLLGHGFRSPLRWATAVFPPRKEASPAFIPEGGRYLKIKWSIHSA